MTERERLIQLLQSSHCVELWNHNTDDFIEPNPIEKLADYLLANGVSVPPCKLGQKVWCICNYSNDYTKPMEYQITILSMTENYYSFAMETKNGVYEHYCNKDDVGKWVFFTREEAEKALAERR
jgi:hypothetical protein